ncbi:uncharacterized protein LOC143274574 [Babylonia areolata]|uniref:uncharacterized protein LOC143274574 n=1 Tax=Babylonia areolata TaxID=304850 RepID=UPI003FD43E73
MKLYRCLALLLLLLLSLTPALLSAQQQAEGDSSEVRAEVCAAACHDAMHWEICARDSGCHTMEGDAQLFCMDSCLHNGVDCEFTCWDSFDAIMSTCSGRCRSENNNGNGDGDGAQCRKGCFLRQYANQWNGGR